MAVKSGETYSGILYDFTDGENGVKIALYDYKTTRRNREPDVVSYDTGSYASEGVTKSALQRLHSCLSHIPYLTELRCQYCSWYIRQAR